MVRTNDKHKGKLSYDNPLPRYIAAGVLALTLHMSFLLFSQAPDVDEGKIENPKYVTLLPLDTKIPSEKKLLQWMDIMDPTCVVKPDRKNGFSVAPDDPMPQDKPIALKKHYTQVSKGEFLPLSSPVEKRRERVKRLWTFSFAKINPPLFNIPQKTKKVFPVWMKDDGTALPQLFRDFAPVKNILKTTKEPLGETVLKLEANEPGFFPRVQLDVSCGNTDLDKLAIKTLAIKGRAYFEDQENGSDPYFIVVKWRE